ncbi:hypothetical protein F8M41_001703 [Gigaspora margarita]|uniref:F-box domain-containing protein n=1 Tax=Gigaspora margarita TaxID=4874 RepID=A0A8H4A7K6_GIGMA|nr:hypothetical protein F8M41_001703 [Gigaspora margarita]
MTELPTEIYFIIFYNLKNDFHGLFTCTRVNRTWCENVIPILWSEPDLHLRDNRLIQVLFLTLNAEEQTLLIPFDIIGSGQARPLFNYTNFIRSIPKDHLYYGIKNWLPPLKDTGIRGTDQPRIQDERRPVTEKPVTDELRQDAVTCSLIAMLLRTSANLKQFYINDEVICNQLIFKKLCEKTSITSLDVHYTNEVMDGLEIFLNNNPALTTFNLKSKEFGAEKMEKLVKALCKITALNFLDLHNSRISTEEEWKILGKFLEKNTTLTSLALNENYLKSDLGLKEEEC